VSDLHVDRQTGYVSAACGWCNDTACEDHADDPSEACCRACYRAMTGDEKAYPCADCGQTEGHLRGCHIADHVAA